MSTITEGGVTGAGPARAPLAPSAPTSGPAIAAPTSGPVTAAPRTTRYIVQGALAMAVLGASTAVSARITDYPVLGGQALRYTLAAAVFAVLVRRRDLPP